MKNPVSRLVLLLVLWGAAAIGAGSFSLLAHLPPAGTQLLVAGLTVAFSVALATAGWLRAAAAAVGVRTILKVHVFRFVGGWFLWLHAQGRLPAEFAHRAGWGDIVAASAAALLLLCPDGPGFRRALFWWNLVGAADLVVAVGTAGWLNLTQPGSMVELTRLPLTVIPLCLVPVLLSSHLYLLRRQLCPGQAGPALEEPGPA